MSSRFPRTIYVGNLPLDIKESEIDDLFYKYGRLKEIELKVPPRPPCFCFVEFESSRAAEDAIRGRDGYNFDGCRLRVELAHGGRGPSSSILIAVVAIEVLVVILVDKFEHSPSRSRSRSRSRCLRRDRGVKSRSVSPVKLARARSRSGSPHQGRVGNA